MHLQPIYLLDEEEILARAVTVEDFLIDFKLWKGHTGIYFLIEENKIIYVGSTSRRIRQRIHEHRKIQVPFSKVYAQPLPDEYIYRAMEILYIGELQPVINKTLKY